MTIGLSPTKKLLAAPIAPPLADESVFDFIRRVSGKFDLQLYCRILGAANEFKEGDEIVGISAADESSRRHARSLLAQTRLADINAQPPFTDELLTFIVDRRRKNTSEISTEFNRQTLGQLKQFLLQRDEADVQKTIPMLTSDVIGCVVKAALQRRVNRRRAEGIQPAAWQSDWREGLPRRPRTTQFAHRSSGGHSLAGLQCFCLRRRRRIAGHQPGVEHSGIGVNRRANSAGNLGGVRDSGPHAALRVVAHRRAK